MQTRSRRSLGRLVLASVALIGCSGTPPVDAGDANVAADVPMFADMNLVDAFMPTDVAADAVDAFDVAADRGNDVGTNPDTATDVGRDVPAVIDVPVATDVVADANTCPSAGAYPAGPFGTAIGSVMTNYTWRGIVMPGGSTEPSTGALATVQLSAVRDRGCRYAIVHMATPG